METESFIAADEFCAIHQIEYSFIKSLHDLGLVEITYIKDVGYLKEKQIKKLEKILRLHTDLEINAEGIDTISHLLLRMRKMEQEIYILKNKLRLYEDF